MKDPQNQNPEMETDDNDKEEPKRPDRNAMKLKGLPYSVTKEDVVKFFHGLGMVDDSVKIGVMGDGKLTGEACVLFENPEDCTQAHTSMNHQHIGTRWVNLIMVPAEEHTSFETN